MSVMKLYYDDTLNRLETMYTAGFVKRMHTVPTLGHHSIAEHVYGSLLIGVELCAWNQVPTQNIMLSLLYHDSAETDTGDIPAPVKRASIHIKEAIEVLEADFQKETGHPDPILSKLEADIVKASDTLDLMFKCVHERRLGNRHKRVEIVMNNVLNYITAQVHIKGVLEIAAYLKFAWEELK